jgi:hypothetical protein
MMRLALTLVLVALLAGCATGPASVASAPPPSSPVSPDPSFEAIIATAVQFRQSVGLRADDAWVRAVAADPGAVWQYGVPLTVAEQAELDRRSADVGTLGPILQAYGDDHAAEFAGLFIDHESGGVLVMLFTDHIAEHDAAIRQLVRPGAPIEVRHAPLAETDLMALMNRITADDDRLKSLGVAVLTTALDTMANRVAVGVSTERPDAGGLLASIYGPILDVTVIDPTGAFLKPKGTVIVTTTDGRGQPVAACVYAEALFAELDRDAVGCEPEPSGIVRVQEQPGRWRLTTQAEGYAPASVDVDIPAGGTIRTDIVVRPAPH